MSTALAEKLAAKRAEFSKMVPQDVQNIMQESARKLHDSGILGMARKAGENAPDFTLKNVFGKLISFAELRKEQRVVICFYRGGW